MARWRFINRPYDSVGKSYAINIEAEKMTFSELSNIVVELFRNWRVGIFGGRTA